jgi:peptide/nickel transport system permease protein
MSALDDEIALAPAAIFAAHAPDVEEDLAADGADARRGPTRRVLRRLMRQPGSVVALLFLAMVAVAGLFAPWLAPFDPNEQFPLEPFETPSWRHWLGTDNLGRDNLSRLMHGTRVSLLSAVLVVGMAAVVALPIGLQTGYRGGRFDRIVMRIVDAGMAFPALVLALAVAGALGPGTANAVLALTIVFVPGLVRLVRGQALVVREATFVEASRSMGTSTRRVLLRHILPNVRGALLVQMSLALGAALLAEASLSYLGLGAVRPTATWGNMLRGAYDNSLFTQPWQLIAPAMAIALTVLSFNTVGEGLRDAFGAARSRQGRAERKGLTTVRLERDAIAPAAVASGPSPLLSVRGLTLEFVTEHGAARVVEELSLDIGMGEVLGLVGESGSGKSVTALAIARLLPSPPARIVSGSVRFDGADILSMGFGDVRRIRGNDIAMIFQDPMVSLDPSFTIGDQLVEAQMVHGRRRGAARARAAELLDLVGIPEPRRRLSAYPHQLSGGMRQRVMIAIALSCEPRLLIADEPTTALDVTVQAQILDLLRRLQPEFDMSILLITHDLGVVADICDRVAVMYAGQVVEQRPVRELFESPRHPYTAGLLAAMPQVGVPASRLADIPGRVPLPTAYPTGCRFRDRCSHVADACHEPASPIVLGPNASTRCVRYDDLVLAGVVQP